MPKGFRRSPPEVSQFAPLFFQGLHASAIGLGGGLLHYGFQADVRFPWLRAEVQRWLWIVFGNLRLRLFRGSRGALRLDWRLRLCGRWGRRRQTAFWVAATTDQGIHCLHRDEIKNGQIIRFALRGDERRSHEENR